MRNLFWRTELPRLIDISRLKEETQNFYEFFRGVRYDGYGRGHHSFDIKMTYPYETYVHGPTQKEDDPDFLLDLRRFVERRAAGDVVYHYKNMGYKWCWNHKDVKNDWDRSYTDISHGYWVLNFEEQGDLTMFKLHKPNLVTDHMSKFHPRCDYHDDNNTRNW